MSSRKERISPSAPGGVSRSGGVQTNGKCDSPCQRETGSGSGGARGPVLRGTRLRGESPDTCAEGELGRMGGPEKTALCERTAKGLFLRKEKISTDRGGTVLSSERNQGSSGFFQE